MKSKYILYAIILLGFSVLFLIFSLNINPVERGESDVYHIGANELLLEESVIPEHWHRTCNFNCQRYEGTEYAERTFEDGVVGRIIQEVTRYPSISEAQRRYNLAFYNEFEKSAEPSSTPLRTPDTLPFFSSIAEDSYFGCGVDGISICRYILRYENYFIYVYFSELETNQDHSSGLLLSEISVILENIDSQLTRRFNITMPSEVRKNPTPRFLASPTPPNTIQASLALLNSTNPEIRLQGVNAIYQNNFNPSSYIEDLTDLLVREKVSNIRIAIIKIFRELENKSILNIPVLCEILLADPSIDMRLDTAILLGQTNNTKAIPCLAEALYDYDIDVALPRLSAESLALLTGVQFVKSTPNGNVFDDNGELWIVRSAKEWWETEGRYKGW